MNLGLIGNCSYNALIDDKGSVVWLCWPRFDSSSVFCSLLDDEKGGSFDIKPAEKMQGNKPWNSKQEYIQNTNVLRTEYSSKPAKFEIIDFAPRYNQFDRSYKPTSLIRIVRPLEGQPVINVRCNPTYDYGITKPAISTGSNHIRFEGLPAQLRLTTNAPLTYITEETPFVLAKTLYFALTWGQPLEASLKQTCEMFLEKTVSYWRRWVKRCTLPKLFQEEVIRSALVLKLHQFEDTGAIIAATTTSLPESAGSVRNWDYRYCWLRDAFFTLSAFRYLGQFEELEMFADYIRNIASLSTPERLQPVYGIDLNSKLTEIELSHLKGYKGHQPVRIGNQAYTHIQNDIYGEVILAVAPLFLDPRFVADEDILSVKLIENMLTHIENKIYEKDAGLWEFRNTLQIHTFSLLMHWLGAREAVKIGEKLKLKSLSAKAARIMKKAADFLENKCWNPRLSCYTQAPGTTELDASLLCMINDGYIKHNSKRINTHLHAIEKRLVRKDGLVYRYLHRDDFGKPHSTFTVCGFWYIEALCRTGNYAKARKLMEKYCSLANNLGLLSEDIDPKDLSLWGNFPQTYSHVGLINCAFQF